MTSTSLIPLSRSISSAISLPDKLFLMGTCEYFLNLFLILAALEAVDLITGFSEDTPYDLILKTGPNVLVKGDDYNEEDIVGADIVKEMGGEVKTVPLVSGFSTTDLIKKIANN